LAVVIVAIGLAYSTYYLIFLWTLKPDGLSEMSSRLPYWDFTNLWAGTKMALNGGVATVFDVEAYRRDIRMMLSPLMLDQEWSYPPSMILFGVPFALLPIFPAYVIWTVATLLLLLLTTRLLGLPLVAGLLILCSPAATINAIFGQNGALTASLLLSGLLLSPGRPVLAGVLFGLLTIKPQLGLLVPFCLLASGNYKAIVSAGVTTTVLVVATGLAFGFDSWLLFITKTRPLMTAILEAPYPQGYQVNAFTVFITARSLGLGLAASYAVQAIFSVFSIAAVIWLWSGNVRINHVERVCLTGVLALLATPYGYTYDAIPLNVAVVCIYLRREGGLPILALAWLYLLFNHQLTVALISAGPLVAFLLVVWGLRRVWKDQQQAVTHDPALQLP
jgi:hypothetical protein